MTQKNQGVALSALFLPAFAFFLHVLDSRSKGIKTCYPCRLCFIKISTAKVQALMAFLVGSCRCLFLLLVALSRTCAEMCASQASIHGNASCDDVAMMLGIHKDVLDAGNMKT